MKIILSAYLFIAFLLPSTALASGEVNVFVWSDAIPVSVLQAFEKETGIKVNYSTYDSTETMVAKLRASRRGQYDIVEPSSYYVPRMIRNNMLKKLDHSKLSNLQHIDKQLLNRNHDPHNQYTIPYILGITGIFYHKQYTNRKINSWNDLWDPEFRDQLLLIDDARELFSIALLSLGYEANSSNPNEIKQAYEKLTTLLPNIKLFASDVIASILADEDAYSGVVWNGDVVKAQRENPHLAFAYPNEGAIMFIDSLAIPNNAPNTKNAYQLINFLMRPEIAKQTAIEFGYTIANKGAYELLPKEMQNNPFYYPDKSIIEKGHFQSGISDEAIALISRYWTLLKLSA